MTESRRLLVLFNSGAGGGSKSYAGGDFVDRLLAGGFEITAVEVKDPQQLDKIVSSQSPNHDAIVVGGGDGSMRNAVGAVLKADLPMATWPLGTANDFARSLGINDAEDCLKALARWTERRVDVARANGHYFLNNATLGLPADAASQLTPDLKRRFGVLATLARFSTLWRKANAFQAEIESGDRLKRFWILAALVGNGRYEGGFPVRYSGLSDGQLHLILCRGRTRWALFPILFDVALRRLPSSRRVEELAVDSVVIRTTRPRQVAIDGDILTETPVTVDLQHAALRVLV